MILLALDLQLEDDQTEAAVYTDSDSFTIEHIMPQAWKKHWPLPLEDFPEWDKDQVADYREDFIHTIGNLTLLTNKLNPRCLPKIGSTSRVRSSRNANSISTAVTSLTSSIGTKIGFTNGLEFCAG